MSKLANLLLSRDLYSVSPDQPVEEVARHMAKCDIGAILVLEDGALRGLFSERDLLTRVVAVGRDPSSTAVRDVMTAQLATIDESATVNDAMGMMQEWRCRHLPVLRRERDGAESVLGLISMRDLMQFELEHKSEEIAHMRAYINGAV